MLLAAACDPRKYVTLRNDRGRARLIPEASSRSVRTPFATCFLSFSSLRFLSCLPLSLVSSRGTRRWLHSSFCSGLVTGKVLGAGTRGMEAGIGLVTAAARPELGLCVRGRSGEAAGIKRSFSV